MDHAMLIRVASNSFSYSCSSLFLPPGAEELMRPPDRQRVSPFGGGVAVLHHEGHEGHEGFCFRAFLLFMPFVVNYNPEADYATIWLQSVSVCRTFCVIREFRR
jgi:hypothetical protein